MVLEPSLLRAAGKPSHGRLPILGGQPGRPGLEPGRIQGFGRLAPSSQLLGRPQCLPLLPRDVFRVGSQDSPSGPGVGKDNRAPERIARRIQTRQAPGRSAALIGSQGPLFRHRPVDRMQSGHGWPVRHQKGTRSENAGRRRKVAAKDQRYSDHRQPVGRPGDAGLHQLFAPARSAC